MFKGPGAEPFVPSTPVSELAGHSSVHVVEGDEAETASARPVLSGLIGPGRSVVCAFRSVVELRPPEQPWCLVCKQGPQAHPRRSASRVFVPPRTMC